MRFTPLADDRSRSRRHLQRVLRQDFLEPVRRGKPLPEGAFDRLAMAADDYLQADSVAWDFGPFQMMPDDAHCPACRI